MTFARTGQADTSGLSGERFDAFVAGNVGESIATFCPPNRAMVPGSEGSLGVPGQSAPADLARPVPE